MTLYISEVPTWKISEQEADEKEFEVRFTNKYLSWTLFKRTPNVFDIIPCRFEGNFNLKLIDFKVAMVMYYKRVHVKGACSKRRKEENWSLKSIKILKEPISLFFKRQKSVRERNDQSFKNVSIQIWSINCLF